MADETTAADPIRDPAYDEHRRRAEVTALAQPSLLRRVSWGAILTGAVIAFALQFLLGLLGVAIGASVFDAQDPAGFGDWGVGTGLYIVFSQVVSLVAGGFVAARLSGIPKNTTALAHGATVWATVTFVSAYFVVSGIGSLLGGATSAASSLASGTASAVEAVLPDDLPNIPTPDLDLAALPPEVRETLQRNDVSVEALRSEVRDIYRDTVSQSEQRRISEALGRTARDVATSPGDAVQDIEDAIDRIVGRGGILSDEELAQLQDSLQAELGVSDREAQQIVREVEQVAEEAGQAVEEVMSTARTEAAQAAEDAAEATSSAARTAFIASLLGLIAAALGGLAGEPKHALIGDERRVG